MACQIEEELRAVRPNRVRFTVHRPKMALAVAWATLTLTVTAVFDRCFFADTNLPFRLNAASALVVPSALLAGTVALVVWVVTSSRRIDGRQFKVREAMLAIALLGLGLGTARWWVCYHFETVYAPGYSEGQFRRVRVGMTPNEVESIVGRPSRKDSTSQRCSPSENWIYSEPPPHGTIGDNYWTRWVLFDDGKVAAIVDDYYEDGPSLRGSQPNLRGYGVIDGLVISYREATLATKACRKRRVHSPGAT
jgi:hypothetical protein